MSSIRLVGERERANLVVQLARFFAIYNVQHSPSWRAGASQPSRTTGAIFRYIYIYIYIYGRALHIPYISKCFYVNFFKRNHRVQRSTSISSLAPARQQCPAFAYIVILGMRTRIFCLAPAMVASTYVPSQNIPVYACVHAYTFLL